MLSLASFTEKYGPCAIQVAQSRSMAMEIVVFERCNAQLDATRKKKVGVAKEVGDLV